jgi:hypothetical protein
MRHENMPKAFGFRHGSRGDLAERREIVRHVNNRMNNNGVSK